MTSITAFGETKSARNWSRDPRCVVPHRILVQRIKNGWSPELAITSGGDSAEMKRRLSWMQRQWSA